MKDKKNEEATVEVVKKCFFTKDKVISLVIGIIVGACVSSLIFCFCRRPHLPYNNGNQMIRMQDKNEYRNDNRQNRRQFKAPSTDNSSETEESKDIENKSNN